MPLCLRRRKLKQEIKCDKYLLSEFYILLFKVTKHQHKKILIII